MRQETMELLCKAAEGMGFSLESRDSYSGRGMFGKTTCDVVVDSLGDLLAATAYAARLWELEDTEAVLRDLRRCRMDSMGLSLIIY